MSLTKGHRRDSHHCSSSKLIRRDYGGYRCRYGGGFHDFPHMSFGDYDNNYHSRYHFKFPRPHFQFPIYGNRFGSPGYQFGDSWANSGRKPQHGKNVWMSHSHTSECTLLYPDYSAKVHHKNSGHKGENSDCGHPLNPGYKGESTTSWRPPKVGSWHVRLDHPQPHVHFKPHPIIHHHKDLDYCIHHRYDFKIPTHYKGHSKVHGSCKGDHVVYGKKGPNKVIGFDNYDSFDSEY